MMQTAAKPPAALLAELPVQEQNVVRQLMAASGGNADLSQMINMLTELRQAGPEVMALFASLEGLAPVIQDAQGQALLSTVVQQIQDLVSSGGIGLLQQQISQLSGVLGGMMSNLTKGINLSDPMVVQQLQHAHPDLLRQMQQVPGVGPMGGGGLQGQPLQAMGPGRSSAVRGGRGRRERSRFSN